MVPTEQAVPSDRAREFLRASAAIVERLDVEIVLRRIVEAAMALVDARYGALGVIRPDGSLERFIHAGIDEQTAEAIGHVPEGHGVLGAVIAEGAPVRLEHVTEDPRFVGFPPHHPVMDSFLGVPIRVGESVYGDLYLSDRQGRPFTDADEQLVVALAATAGIAIEHARLYDAARAREMWRAAIAEVMGALLDASADEALGVIVDRVAPLVGAEVATLADPADDTHLATRPAREPSDADAQQVADAGPPDETGLDARPVPSSDGGDGRTLAIPLRSGDTSLGVLAISRATTAAPFTDADLEMAAIFADQCALALQLVRGREDRRRLELARDRARIARDLHDHVIQRLFGAGLALQAIATGAEPALAGDLTEQIDALDASITEIRTVVLALGAAEASGRPGTRDRLLSIVSEVTAAASLTPHVSFGGAIDSLVERDLADDLAAVLREALTNAVRHSGARTADVRVEITGDEVRLRVADDGCGIPPSIVRSGLANIAERARLRGGAALISPAEGGGTVVEWTVPLDPEEDPS